MTDFGLARESTSHEGTRPAGTPAYMAPEMFDGAASPRSDVYALGILAFQLLTNSTPFSGSFGRAAVSHRADPLPVDRLRECNVPAALIDVIERAAHKNALFRYKSAGLLARAIRDVVGPDEIKRGESELAALVRRCMAGPPEPEAPAGPETPPSSYFDRIAQIAAAKRSQDHAAPVAAQLKSPAKEHHPATAQGMQPDAEADVRAICIDLKCARCEYNLRTQPIVGRCPECASPVWLSIRPEPLRLAEREWLASRRWAGGASGMGAFNYMLPVSAALMATAVSGGLYLFLGAVGCLALAGLMFAWAEMPEPNRIIPLAPRPFLPFACWMSAVLVCAGPYLCSGSMPNWIWQAVFRVSVIILLTAMTYVVLHAADLVDRLQRSRAATLLRRAGWTAFAFGVLTMISADFVTTSANSPRTAGVRFWLMMWFAWALAWFLAGGLLTVRLTALEVEVKALSGRKMSEIAIIRAVWAYARKRWFGAAANMPAADPEEAHKK